MKSIFNLILLLLIAQFVCAQTLIKSNQTSTYKYLYKISNEEALRIHKKGMGKSGISLLNRFPIDSIRANVDGWKQLKPGHYIEFYTQKGEENYEYLYAQNCAISSFSRDRGCQLKVFDFLGNEIRENTIKSNGSIVKYDVSTQSFILGKFKGIKLVEVLFNGVANYFVVQQDKPYKPEPFYKRITRNWYWENLYNRLFVYKDNNYTGYIALSKPKYRPNDTLKVKAFILDRKGNTIDKPLNVRVYSYKMGKDYRVNGLKPYRPGAYMLSLPLVDSLGFKLDMVYNVDFFDPKKEENTIYKSFQFEDYELKSNTLKVRTSNDMQVRDTPFSIWIRGVDINNMSVQDARLRVVITPRDVQKIYSPKMHVLDTLWIKKLPLEPKGETQVDIPDSIFRNMNLQYNLFVEMITSDNEVLSEKKQINFCWNKEEISTDLKGDSLYVEYKVNGKSLPCKVGVAGVGMFHNEVYKDSILLPSIIKVNRAISTYMFSLNELTSDFILNDHIPNVSFDFQRTTDSLLVSLQNSIKATVSYVLYRNGSRLKEGYGDSIAFAIKADPADTYQILGSYLWGGKTMITSNLSSINTQQLRLSLDSPSMVVPGQVVEMKIKAQDYRNKGVADVDILAKSVTAKFKEGNPSMFAYNPKKLPRYTKIKHQFSIPNLDDLEVGDVDYSDRFDGLTSLRYQQWSSRLQLDSIEFYKFLYPNGKVYINREAIKDSITQFAPFINRNGKQVKIYVIYVDELPCYFSWSDNPSDYSFRITKGFHNIKLRTKDKLITLKNFYIKPGCKTVVSFSDTLSYDSISYKKMADKLTTEEVVNLSRYTLQYRNIQKLGYAYLMQNGNLIMLKMPWYSNSSRTLGPILPINTFFNAPASFKLEPFSPESDFEYEFLPHLIKMRSCNVQKILPKKLYDFDKPLSVKDSVWSENSVLQQDSLFQLSTRTLLYRSYPQVTKPGFSRICLVGSRKNTQSMLRNVRITSYINPDDFRVYSSTISSIEQLTANRFYKLEFVYDSKAVITLDSLKGQAFSTIYINIPDADGVTPTKESVSIFTSIEDYLYGKDEKVEVVYDDIFSKLKTIEYTGDGVVVEGVVIDKTDNQPIPGVNVLAYGTPYGTLTDLNGRYSIKVPAKVRKLSFMFIGYEAQEYPVEETDLLARVMLKPASQHLDEVVVVGYGISSKRSYTAATSVVQEGLAGAVDGIMIRGASSLNETSPLIIIDGEVYTGEISPDMVGSMEVLKDEKMVSIYGSRAANGVIIIKSKGGKGASFSKDFMELAMQSSGIRSHFSDEAFWLPNLKTDAKGEVSFKVKFPDDITTWNTSIYGVKDSKHLAGVLTKSIKSLKPMSAQLSLPRFMVQGDSAKAIGKVLNYTGDTIGVKVTYDLNGVEQMQRSYRIINSVVDTLSASASSLDTLKLAYKFSMSNGYSDGETRDVNIVPRGLEKSVGRYLIIQPGDSAKLSFDSKLGRVSFIADTDPLSLLKEHAKYLLEYKYECNEQLASKLMGLMAQKAIADAEGVKFRSEKEVKRILGKLKKNENKEGLWSWWGNGETNWTMSNHVLAALSLSKKFGYNISIDSTKITQDIIYKLGLMGSADRLKAMLLLSQLGSKVNYSSMLDTISRSRLPLSELLLVNTIYSNIEAKPKLKEFDKYLKETLKGNIYLMDVASNNSYFYSNELLNNIRLLRLYQRDSAFKPIAKKVFGYLLEYATTASYLNTYERANLLEVAIPFLVERKSTGLKSELAVSGDTSHIVKNFPYTMTVDPSKRVMLKNDGGNLVYVSVVQKQFLPDPQPVDTLFAVYTQFKNGAGKMVKHLVGGEKVTMEVVVDTKKMGNYVMIRVPIPAGCTYESKSPNVRSEAYREYFEDCVCIFVNRLDVGQRVFTIDLMPRYDGSYTVNPAKVEPMYSPTQMGNGRLSRIKVGK